MMPTMRIAPRTTAATPVSSKIPAALSRLSSPNRACRMLMGTSNAWNEYCAGQPMYDSTLSPYANMPPGGRQIQQMASIPLSSITPGVDTPVLTFTAPIGYDGVIVELVNFFTGTGFAEGSGGLVWRVKIGNSFARNLGNILFTYGSLQDHFAIPGIGIPIVSGQIFTYYVNVPVGSPVGGSAPQIVCGAFGWFWSRV